MTFSKFVRYTLENQTKWKKDVLWLLGLIFASSDEKVTNLSTKILPKIIENSHKLKNPDFGSRSEAMICLYNLFSNFESRVFIQFLKENENHEILFESFAELLKPESVSSPYLLQISLSFWCLLCEVVNK